MTDDRLQYEFSDSLGGDYFDLRFSQSDELGEWLCVYIAPELQRHVSPEGIASCINNAYVLYKTQGVSEPVRVAIRTAAGTVTMLVSFGVTDPQPVHISCDWGGISKGLIGLQV